MVSEPRAVIVVGVQAAGKSTVGKLLAARLRRAAFIEGDQLWQMIVAGREDMAEPPSAEARRQLQLRYRHGGMLAASFVANGFHAVHVDNIYGADVQIHLDSLTVPRSLVVLCPQPEAIERRERERGTSAYSAWTKDGSPMIDAIRMFDSWLRETPSIGLWLDTSDLTADQAVTEILDRWTDAFIQR